MAPFGELLNLLSSAKVDFVLVGGVAAAAHGSPGSMQVFDLVYNRSEQNPGKIVEALGPLHPYLRGAPPGLPFRFDVATLKAGLNFTLVTDLGWIDLLGEVAGGGRYEQLLPHSVEIEAFGTRCRVLDLDTLIRTKRAAGRPKDLEAISELESLRERQR